MSRYFLILACSVSLGLVSATCSSPEREKMIKIGPEVKASLVIFFKAGVSDQQIEEFWHTVLSKPDPNGRGHYPLEGVGDITRVFQPVQGHEAIAVTFFPDATQAQREVIKTAVKSSPIVYKVLENIPPADVKSIE